MSAREPEAGAKKTRLSAKALADMIGTGDFYDTPTTPTTTTGGIILGTLLIYLIWSFVFAYLLVVTLNTKTVTYSTTIEAKPTFTSETVNCTALGTWDTRTTFPDRKAMAAKNGFHFLVTASMSSMECNASTASTCSRFADDYVGPDRCCLWGDCSANEMCGGTGNVEDFYPQGWLNSTAMQQLDSEDPENASTNGFKTLGHGGTLNRDPYNGIDCFPFSNATVQTDGMWCEIPYGSASAQAVPYGVTRYPTGPQGVLALSTCNLDDTAFMRFGYTELGYSQRFSNGRVNTQFGFPVNPCGSALYDGGSTSSQGRVNIFNSQMVGWDQYAEMKTMGYFFNLAANGECNGVCLDQLGSVDCDGSPRTGCNASKIPQKLFQQPYPAYKNNFCDKSTPKACGDSATVNANDQAPGGYEFVANDPHYLDRDEFSADCQAAVDDICSQMDVMCAPFACIQKHESYPTFFTAVGIANGNSALALTIAGTVLGIVMSKVAGIKRREEDLRGSTSPMTASRSTQPLAIEAPKL